MRLITMRRAFALDPDALRVSLRFAGIGLDPAAIAPDAQCGFVVETGLGKELL